MKYAVALVVLLFSLQACEGLEWHDCGMPLQRWISYEDVTLSPADDIQTGALLSLNIFAVMNQPITPSDTINTLLTIIKDDQLFMNASTRSLCDMLSANKQGCSYSEGDKISFTYQFYVPVIPRGNYTIRLYQTSTQLGVEVGCAQLSTTVEGITTPKSCTYQSQFDAQFQGTFHFAHPNPIQQQVGDYIQVANWGENAGASASAFTWGTFSSITGTVDIIGNTSIDPTNYVWGLNGTLVAMSNGTNPLHVYNGTVVVGYNYTSNNTIQFVYGGSFSFVFEARSSGNTYNLQQSYIALFSRWYHPVGFPYPLVIGNLDPLTVGETSIPVTVDQSGAILPITVPKMSISGIKNWCTCGDTCGLGGGDFDRQQVAAGTNKQGLSLTAQAAIAVGVVGSVALVMATIFFVVHYRSSKRPILDPSEVVYPNKPDYGNLALGEIIDEETGEHRLI